MFVLFCIDSHSVFLSDGLLPPPDISTPHLPAIYWSVSCFSCYAMFFHGHAWPERWGFVARWEVHDASGVMVKVSLHNRRTNVKQSFSDLIKLAWNKKLDYLKRCSQGNELNDVLVENPL